jgi:hypothetical protein
MYWHFYQYVTQERMSRFVPLRGRTPVARDANLIYQKNTAFASNINVRKARGLLLAFQYGTERVTHLRRLVLMKSM